MQFQSLVVQLNQPSPAHAAQHPYPLRAQVQFQTLVVQLNQPSPAHTALLPALLRAQVQIQTLVVPPNQPSPAHTVPRPRQQQLHDYASPTTTRPAVLRQL